MENANYDQIAYIPPFRESQIDTLMVSWLQEEADQLIYAEQAPLGRVCYFVSALFGSELACSIRNCFSMEEYKAYESQLPLLAKEGQEVLASGTVFISQNMVSVILERTAGYHLRGSWKRSGSRWEGHYQRTLSADAPEVEPKLGALN